MLITMEDALMQQEKGTEWRNLEQLPSNMVSIHNQAYAITSTCKANNAQSGAISSFADLKMQKLGELMLSTLLTMDCVFNFKELRLKTLNLTKLLPSISQVM